MEIENEEICQDRVEKAFDNKILLITGVTGFVGKVLLEKLLRACPGIDKIYVLIRPKYNLSSRERLEKIFRSALFDLFKRNASSKEQISRVFAIQGDVSIVGLGLSAADRQLLLQEVEIVYHCAALLRLDESLKTSVLMNVRGTRSMLDLAKDMTNLKVFCHVSSAYCHVHQRVIYEKPYDPPADPDKIVEICEKLEESAISALTHKILDNYPNTYCFTKALSEGLINKELNSMPIILLRPSLVIPALKEPIPGWTDTINGSIGFQIAAGKGILRTLHADVTRYPDLIPVDITVNAFICAAYDYLTRPENERITTIYNLITSDKHKVSWYDIIYIGRDVILNSIPLNWVVWYPGGSFKPTKFLHDCTFLVQHVLPSVIVDGILWMFNRKPILLPIYRRIQKGFEILKFYNGKQWDFSNEQSMKALEALNASEKRKYHFDAEFDYREYFSDCTLCARRYILNESDETLPRARQHMKMMYYVDKFVVTLFLFWLFTTIFNLISNKFF